MYKKETICRPVCRPMFVCLTLCEDDTAILHLMPVEETVDPLVTNFGVTPRSNLDQRPQRTDLNIDVQNRNPITDFDPWHLAQLMEENRRLREARTCEVCMDSEVNTVFLPCGHLVCCDTCSPALRNCAVCRALIRGTVKVFLQG